MLPVNRRGLHRRHSTGDPSKRTRPPSPIFPPFFYPSLTTDLYSDCPGPLSATFGKIHNYPVTGAGFEQAWRSMAFSLIYTQRAPTRMWPQAASKPAVLLSRIFSSPLTSTRDALGSGRAAFSILPWGPDLGTRRKILLRWVPRYRRTPDSRFPVLFSTAMFIRRNTFWFRR